MTEEKQKRSVDDIQREIAEVDLQTKQLALSAQKRSNDAFIQEEKRRKTANRQRMKELAQGQRTREEIVRECRHKSGGNPARILKGGGVGSFSLISRAVMPDGVTILLQCPRCQMKEYPPSETLKKTDPELYLKKKTEYNRLLEESLDRGIENSELRGPTFLFKNADGVPFIPERL